MIKAVIDVGTNSIKCTIAVVEQGKVAIIEDVNLIPKLGEDLASTGKIGPAAMERNITALRGIQAACAKHKVDKVVCVGAETLRKAADADVFIEKVREEFGWELRTLKSDEEAELTFLASSLMAPEGKLVLVFDCGGGSTEFTYGRGKNILAKTSLPLGALVLTKKFLFSDPAKPEESKNLEAYVAEVLAKALPAPEQAFTIGCGGSLTTLASVSLALEVFDADRIHGLKLTSAEMDRQANIYGSLKIDERTQIKGLRADRAPTILAGALILKGIMQYLGLKEVTVSTNGLRHALLIAD